MQKPKVRVYFEISQLLPIGLTFIVLAIAVGYGLTVIEDVKSDECAFSYDVTTGKCLNSTGGSGGTITYTGAYNASNNTIVGVSKIPSKMGLIVTVVLAAVILGVLVRYMFVKFN